MVKRITTILFCFSIFLSVPLLNGADSDPALGDESWSRERLAPGVELLRRHFEDLFNAPQFICILTIDLKEPGVKVRFATADQLGEERLAISDLAARSDALAAINGGFGHGGPGILNSGIIKIDGVVLPFLNDEPDELYFVGGSAIGIDEKGSWHFRVREGTQWLDEWGEVDHALAGGHMLILNGEIFPVVEKEEYTTDREINHAGRRHPRTAIGMTADSIGLLLTVDGRHPSRAEGMTLRELAHFLKMLGCMHAMNLDGGGSTTMWTSRHGVVNHPSGNRHFDADGLRFLKNGVLIYKKE